MVKFWDKDKVGVCPAPVGCSDCGIKEGVVDYLFGSTFELRQFGDLILCKDCFESQPVKMCEACGSTNEDEFVNSGYDDYVDFCCECGSVETINECDWEDGEKI